MANQSNIRGPQSIFILKEIGTPAEASTLSNLWGLGEVLQSRQGGGYKVFGGLWVFDLFFETHIRCEERRYKDMRGLSLYTHEYVMLGKGDVTN